MRTLVEQEKIRNRYTATQRIALIEKWHDFMVERTESFSTDDLSLDLAYFWPAIASAGYVELGSSAPLVRFLKANKVPKKSEVWDFIYINPDLD